MDKKAADYFASARSNLLLDHYFFGRLAMYLKPVQSTDGSVKTLAVDGKHIFYNPTFFTELSAALRKSAIAHEVFHCVFEHIVRRRGRDPQLWNKAGDYAINLELQKAGFQIGSGWLLNPAFDGMSAEQIYDALKEDGQEEAGEALCEIMDASASESDAETASIKQEWAINVAQTAMEAKRRGCMPASLDRFVETLVANKVPWREVLARFITERARDDYSWVRPNRMFVAAGAYLPALYSEAVGHIDVVIDTSGSIGQKELDLFGSEIKAIAMIARPRRLRVIYADAAVNHVDEFASGDEIEFSLRGGGGTDFRPAINLAAEDPPAALVYLTDMYGTFPVEEPDFPVLWVATTDQVAPHGETICMGD